jgi:5-carboxymethyl-2-hydroxymuconate semialdehyde dehydrogenase
MERYRLYIDGKNCDPDGGEWFSSESPFTGKPWAEVPRGGPSDIERAVTAAHRAFVSGSWPELTASTRGLLLHRLADRLAAEASRLAAIEVRDNGKLYAEMHAQLNYLPQWFRYYGGLADKVQGSVIPLDKKGYFNYTRHEPLGVVAVITPWNSPLMLLAWKLAPALAAGCTVVIKPSEFTSASTLAFVQLLEEVGFPPGVVNVVTGFGNEVGAALVSHPLVKKITFTGADETGRRINEQAARDFKHVSLELGGKSPNIVFDDANLDDAVNGAVAGIFAATGQTCIAGSRLLVQDGIHDEFVRRVVRLAETARMGDPMETGTQVGPITTRPQYDKVLSYIGIARAEGAALALGGHPADRPECGNGWFIEPTIFTNVDNRMRIAQEEIFGPVACLIPFDDEADAIKLANDISYGLSSYIWTESTGRALRVAAAVQAGMCFVNSQNVRDLRQPFGGTKASGVGREGGTWSYEVFLEPKNVCVSLGSHHIPRWGV